MSFPRKLFSFKTYTFEFDMKNKFQGSYIILKQDKRQEGKVFQNKVVY